MRCGSGSRSAFPRRRRRATRRSCRARRRSSRAWALTRPDTIIWPCRRWRSRRSSGLFFGQYYLAQIYADNGAAFTNHAKAYELYLRIVDEHANVDPDDDWRAAYVGKSLTAVARYTLRGLPEIGLVPNTERAAKFLRDAATFFGDPDAQFELARMYLKGEGVQEDRKLAFHWLSTLTQKGHAGAQAFLAELLWKGNELARDEKRALALITVAVANAPEADRLWIEDIYQNIFCGSSTGTRAQADGLVAVWKRIYSPRSGAESGERIVGSGARTCGNGEVLPVPERDSRAQDAKPATERRGAGPGQPGLREVGAPQR